MNNISEIIIEKNDLRVVSEFSPAGDQPAAIEELVGGLSCLLYTSDAADEGLV